jgi:hypothetical protein
MATFSALKKKKRVLGVPPSIDQAGNNLAAPEVAPPVPTEEFVDGRSKRRTGRTEQLATRVTHDFHRKVKMIAARDGLKIVELLEKAIELYEEKYSR